MKTNPKPIATPAVTTIARTILTAKLALRGFILPSEPAGAVKAANDLFNTQCQVVPMGLVDFDTLLGKDERLTVQRALEDEFIRMG